MGCGTNQLGPVLEIVAANPLLHDDDDLPCSSLLPWTPANPSGRFSALSRGAPLQP